NDEIINPRRPQSWRDWQRFEDYYDEGALIWLDADTLIRERSNGQRSLDDFARSFFGIDAGSLTTVTLRHSIGIDIDDKDKAGSIEQVVWGSPAFKAGLTSGGRILAVNGVAYSADVLKDAIRTARNAAAPIELIVRTGDAFMVARVDYHGGLRYPHLVRGAATHSRLDDILAPRP
ncbi:MAG: peptidase M61, partial [Steroidobacteraceae bacterium]